MKICDESNKQKTEYKRIEDVDLGVPFKIVGYEGVPSSDLMVRVEYFEGFPEVINLEANWVIGYECRKDFKVIEYPDACIKLGKPR